MTSDSILVVGAGFAGAVCARELADAGYDVVVIDRRAHIGGNAYDMLDVQGVLIHPYGPHLFHTNSEKVVDWLSRFTDWHPYEHRVLAQVNGQLLPIPINLTTINRLYGMNLDGPGVAAFFDKVREPRASIRTSEDAVLNSVGHDLCEKFFRGYTRKHWGLDLSELSASVAARIPTRVDEDDRYFTDSFQALPKQGYTKMFERILKHSRIKVELRKNFIDYRAKAKPFHTVYTGPIDEFFNKCFGGLPYRSLRFEHEHLPQTERFQPVGTVNFPNDHAYTRTTEFKHITGQVHSGTSIVREYPMAHGEPYYPVPREENETLYQRYKVLAENEANVTFVGRLAQYRYYNMDQVVAAALIATKKFLDQKNV
jgi:UDP-galactopyranose mutase